MKSLIYPTAMIALAACTLAQVDTGNTSKGKVYFLRDDGGRRWCAYGNERLLKSRVQTLRAIVVGAASYESNVISVVELTEVDETGDWAVNDAYVLDRKGRITALTRTINIIPEETSERQVYRVVDGRAAKQSSSYRDLRTGKILPAKRAQWFEPPRVITDPLEFGFWALLTVKRQAVGLHGEVCSADAPM